MIQYFSSRTQLSQSIVPKTRFSTPQLFLRPECDRIYMFWAMVLYVITVSEIGIMGLCPTYSVRQAKGMRPGPTYSVRQVIGMDAQISCLEGGKPRPRPIYSARHERGMGPGPMYSARQVRGMGPRPTQSARQLIGMGPGPTYSCSAINRDGTRPHMSCSAGDKGATPHVF